MRNIYSVKMIKYSYTKKVTKWVDYKEIMPAA
jgi:hypothetical protein